MSEECEFKPKAIQVNTEIMMHVLNTAKNLKSEYVLIPRNIMQRSIDSNLIGISYSSIITTGVFEELRYLENVDLWEDPSLWYIMFSTKDILNFNKMRKVVYADNTPPELQLEIRYRTYEINGQETSVAYSLSEILNYNFVVVPNTLPRIDLFPYEDAYNKIKAMDYQRTNSSQIVWNQDITEDESFNDILNSKAGVGSMPWYPRVEGLPEQHPYIIYMASNLLNVSKGDMVKLSMYNHIKDRDDSFFLSQFDIYKKKKKCILTTMMLHMIVF